MSDPVRKDPKDMTPEEVLEAVKQMGAKLGEWQEVEEKEAVPPMMNRQVEALLKLRAILEGMAEQDAKRLASLREQLARLQYGGGS